MRLLLKAELLTPDLEMTINPYQPLLGLIIHTDPGSQYAVDRNAWALHYAGLKLSMSCNEEGR